MKEVLKAVAIGEMLFCGYLIFIGDIDFLVRLLGFIGAQLIIGVAIYAFYSLSVKRKK